MDRRRLADIRAGTAGEQRSSGSGYLTGRRLVLTCRHVVADGQGRVWPRVDVWLGHPADGPPRRVSATVAWVHPNPGVDAALLRIDGDQPAVPGQVRWGWFAGTSPVSYTGLGFPEFADYESGRGVEQLGGVLSPLTVGPDGAFVLDQGAAPEPSQCRAWSGASGAAVFCGGLLVAVVVKDDRAFGNRRLHAAPASMLACEPEFAALLAADAGAAPALEAAELVEFLQPPTVVAQAQTPGSLLAPAVEAVEFTGRAEEMTELAAWRDGGGGFSVLLVAGEGGQGKTRLVREFAASSRRAGWAAGFLAARRSGEAGQAEHRQAAAALAAQARAAARPVLVAVDYAETRPDEVTVLVDVLAGGQQVHPVRLLLLSRAAGAWWDNLAEVLGPHAAGELSLRPLTGAGEGRSRAWAAAVTGLARCLEGLPDAAAGETPAPRWSTLASGLAARPPALDDPRLGNALSLQVSALAGLLGAAAGEPPTVAGETDLVRHERGYLRRAAARRRLFGPGVLSGRADDDERAAQAWQALERALAGVILLGPCGPMRARAVGALASEDRADDVAGWLAGLYPPADGEAGIGAVQPDRIAELLLGPVLAAHPSQAAQRGQPAQPSLAARVGTLAETADDAYQVLFTLIRTAAHPGFGPAAEAAADLIASRPIPFARAAPVLAAALPQAGPLGEGLVRLGLQDPQAFGSAVYPVIDQLSRFSVSGAAFSAALTMTITQALRPLAGANPDAYLPALASALINLSIRLANVGQRQAALGTAREAVETYQRLADAKPGAYLPALANAFSNLSNRLGDVGQRGAALGTARGVAEIYRQLAEENPEVYLPDLARALSNLGIRLGEAGQRQEALDPAREAVGIYRQLAEANPDASLTALAMALNNLSGALWEVGQQQEALDSVRAVAGIYRQLAEENPDVYLPDLAIALNNLGGVLGKVGQWQAALAPVRAAVAIRLLLAKANPGAYLPALANALNTLGSVLEKVGQRQEALDPAREAVGIYRRLAEANPDAYLPALAMALYNLGSALEKVGQQQEALDPAREAVGIYRQLAEANPDAYLRALAGALSSLSDLMAGTGKETEISHVWESAIAALPDSPSQLALLTQQACYLLGTPEPGAGLALLVKILVEPGLPRHTEALARLLLRRGWQQHPGDTEGAWQAAYGTPVPGWLRLTDDHISTVIAWLSTPTWMESRQYFASHADELLSETTSSVLDELSLIDSAQQIGQIRNLLDTIREHGLEAAYEPLLSADPAVQ